MNQLKQWLQDEWMRDFILMMVVWVIGVSVASVGLVLYGPTLY